MFEKFLTKLVQRSNPNRDYSVIKVEKRFFTVARDTVGCNDYLLEGKYSYDEVARRQMFCHFLVRKYANMQVIPKAKLIGMHAIQ